MTARSRLLLNPRRAATAVGFSPTREPLQLHQRLPGYAPTRLVELSEVATALGVGSVWIKDESNRLGLPSFKILGASWAIYRALAERLGDDLEPWRTVDGLADRVAPLRPLTLAAATDGNHGRAVAHVAVMLGFAARIYVPRGTAKTRITMIEREGATVTVVDGSYEAAVQRSTEAADARTLVISDTSWPGYEAVPRWVIDGYSTIFWEVDDQLATRGEGGLDLVVVQIGVGALAAAAVRHYQRADLSAPPFMLGVEPDSAACVLASMEAGKIVSVPGPHRSIMAGLNCDTPSLVAWPLVSTGIDAFVAIDDDRARDAMRTLAAAGLVAGETGAAGLGGLIDLLSGAQADANRSALGITEQTRVLLLSTEGATDPVAYKRIVGRAACPVEGHGGGQT